MTPRSLVNS